MKGTIFAPSRFLRERAFCIGFFMALGANTADARAQPTAETKAVLDGAAATLARALEDPSDIGRKQLLARAPDDAIASFESLCDRGYVDAAASFNRGLAYAQRISFDRESPGDHGQALAALIECEELAPDSSLGAKAHAAAIKVRLDAQRVRGEKGLEPVTEPAPTLRASIRDTFSPFALRAVMLLASLTGALLLIYASQRNGTAQRFLLAMAGISITLTFAFYTLHNELQQHRGAYTSAVVVTPEARLQDARFERGVVGQEAAPTIVPEGSRIFVRRDDSAAFVDIEWGRVRGKLARNALRLLAERP